MATDLLTEPLAAIRTLGPEPTLITAVAGSARLECIAELVAHRIGTGTEPSRILLLSVLDSTQRKHSDLTRGRPIACRTLEHWSEGILKEMDPSSLRVVPSTDRLDGLLEQITIRRRHNPFGGQSSTQQLKNRFLAWRQKQRLGMGSLPVLKRATDSVPTGSPEEIDFRDADRNLQSRLDANGLWLRNDAIRIARELLRDPERLTALAGRYDLIVLDEAQLCSRAGFELLQAMQAAEEHGQIVVVHSPHHDIFQWCGAFPDLIDEFRRQGPIQELVLRDSLLPCSDAIACLNAISPPEIPRSNPCLPYAEGMEIVHEGTTEAMGRSLLETMNRIRERKGLDWSEFCILTRYAQTASSLLEALKSARIPISNGKDDSETDPSASEEPIHPSIRLDAILKLSRLEGSATGHRLEDQLGSEASELLAPALGKPPSVRMSSFELWLSRHIRRGARPSQALMRSAEFARSWENEFKALAQTLASLAEIDSDISPSAWIETVGRHLAMGGPQYDAILDLSRNAPTSASLESILVAAQPPPKSAYFRDGVQVRTIHSAFARGIEPKVVILPCFQDLQFSPDSREALQLLSAGLSHPATNVLVGIASSGPLPSLLATGGVLAGLRRSRILARAFASNPRTWTRDQTAAFVDAVSNEESERYLFGWALPSEYASFDWMTAAAERVCALGCPTASPQWSQIAGSSSRFTKHPAPEGEPASDTDPWGIDPTLPRTDIVTSRLPVENPSIPRTVRKSAARYLKRRVQHTRYGIGEIVSEQAGGKKIKVDFGRQGTIAFNVPDAFLKGALIALD